MKKKVHFDRKEYDKGKFTQGIGNSLIYSGPEYLFTINLISVTIFLKRYVEIK